MDNLDLIDWALVGFASLWILGAAIVVSALGFAYDQSRDTESSLRETLAAPAYRLSMDGGLILFTMGMAGTADPGWEPIVWVLLAAAFLWDAIGAIRLLRRSQ